MADASHKESALVRQQTYLQLHRRWWHSACLRWAMPAARPSMQVMSSPLRSCTQQSWSLPLLYTPEVPIWHCSSTDLCMHQSVSRPFVTSTPPLQNNTPTIQRKPPVWVLLQCALQKCNLTYYMTHSMSCNQIWCSTKTGWVQLNQQDVCQYVTWMACLSSRIQMTLHLGWQSNWSNTPI